MRPVPVNFGGAPIWRCMRLKRGGRDRVMVYTERIGADRSGEPSRGWLPNRVEAATAAGVPRT